MEPNKITDDVIKIMMTGGHNDDDIAKELGIDDIYTVREHMQFIKDTHKERIFLEYFDGPLFGYINNDSFKFFEKFLANGGYQGKINEIKLSEKHMEQAKELDMLLNVLSQSNLKTYYSIGELKRRMTALRIWNDKTLEDSLRILSGDYSPDNSDPAFAYVLTRENKGVREYMFNPVQHEIRKNVKTAAYQLKTEDERKEIDKRELELRKLSNEVYWWKDLRFWYGVGSGAITTGITLWGIYLEWLKK